MEISHELADQRGEPGTPLTLDKQTAQGGDQVHIRLVGPAGGVACVGVVPIGGQPAEFVHEGPDRG